MTQIKRGSTRIRQDRIKIKDPVLLSEISTVFIRVHLRLYIRVIRVPFFFIPVQ
jgi:hypothetical protein